MAPSFAIDGNDISIARNSALLDTCVLIEAFLGGGQNQEYAKMFIDESDFILYVPAFVVVEAWGMIAGSRKDFPGGNSMLSWVSTPGKVTILPDLGQAIIDAQRLITRLKIDYVDACLIGYAHEISTRCDLNPPIRIVTYDTKDFTKASVTREHRFILHDLRTQDDY